MTEGYQIRDQHAIHFLTFTEVNWIDVFSRQTYRDILIDALIYCQRNRHLKVHAYVIMTNHMHSILSNEKEPLSSTIRDYKKYTSNKIIRTIKNERESRKKWMLNQFEFAARKNKRNRYYQFWIQNNHPIELSNDKFMIQRLNYIHENPVKSGTVYKAEDYVYSSASNYAGIDGLLEIDFLY